MGEPTSGHEQRAAAEQGPARVAVLTVSDSRTPQTDRSGPLLRELLDAHGHQVVASAIVRDEPAEIRAKLRQWLADPLIDAIVSTGGTGIASRDTTTDVVRGLLSIELPGFGELFRMLSFQDVGPAAMLSRAVGGLAARAAGAGGEAFVFALPGSPRAVETAVRRLIGPQLSHLVWERRRQ